MQRKDRQNQSIKFALEIYNQQGAYLSQTQSMTHTGECHSHHTKTSATMANIASAH